MSFKKLKRLDIEAFTFLEVVVVVFIVSILAAVVLPSFFGLSTNSHDADARMIASIIRFAKDRAQFSMNEVSIDIDLDEQRLVNVAHPHLLGEKCLELLEIHVFTPIIFIHNKCCYHCSRSLPSSVTMN